MIPKLKHFFFCDWGKWGVVHLKTYTDGQDSFSLEEQERYCLICNKKGFRVL